MKKHVLKKAVAVMLVAVMLVTGINITTIQKKESVKAKENKATEQKVVKELKDLRTADSTTYLLSNGSKQVDYYSQDIRYIKNGKYVDYDSNLKKISNSEINRIKAQSSKFIRDDVENFVYTNISGDSKHYFPESVGEDNGVVTIKDSHAIKMVPQINENSEDSNVTEQSTKNTEDVKETVSDDNTSGNKEYCYDMEKTSDNKILYKNSDNTIKYGYYSNPNGIKEEIVLKKKPENNEFCFKMELNGLKLNRNKYDNQIKLTDEKTGQTVAFIEAPNIKDKNDRLSYDDVAYELDYTEENPILKVVADPEYLENASYPVTIDPSVVWMQDKLESVAVSTASALSDMNLQNSSIISIYNKGLNRVPYEGSECYCYIDTSNVFNGNAFAGKPDLLQDMRIEKATLRLVEYENSSENSQKNGTVEVREINGPWKVDTIKGNNHPDMSEEIMSEFKYVGKHLTQHDVDITDWIRDVAKGKKENNGIALKAKEEGTVAHFYSSQINYKVDDDGKLKGAYMWLSLQYKDVTRYYGQDGVYAPSGNYSESSDDMNVQSIFGDIPITRTYNSMSYENQSVIGNGFSLNYQMQVRRMNNTVKVTMPGSEQWTFEDCDTYFKARDNKGTLTLSDGKYKLVTEDMTEYSFDENGNLEYIKDELGNILNITRDNQGNITKITDDTGLFVKFTYNNGKISKIEDIKSGKVLRTVSYEYTGDYLSKAVYPGKMESHYEYDESGRLINVSASGEKGELSTREIKLTYYNQGSFKDLVKTTEDTIGVTTTLTYDFDNNQTTVTENKATGEEIRQARYTYNDSLCVTNEEDLKMKSDEKQISEVEYQNSEDPDRPKTEKDKYGNVTSYEYDENGNTTKITYPDGSTELSEYDSETNDLLKHTDRLGLVTENTYEDGLLVKVTEGGFVTNSYSYYPEGTYEMEGLVKEETDAHGNIKAYTYDTKGNVLTSNEIVDGEDHITKNTYDDKGNLIKTVDPNGICTEYTYNASGITLLTKVSDKNGENVQITRNVHDALGREIQVIEPAQYQSAKDNIDADLYTDKTVGTYTTYNAKGQVEKVRDPLGNITRYEYDGDGNQIKEIKPNGTFYTYEHDREGRVTLERYHESESAVPVLLSENIYDENVNKVETKNFISNTMSGRTIKESDWEGNVVKETTQSGAVTVSVYEKGLLKKEYTNDGSFAKYSYDKWGRTLKKEENFNKKASGIDDIDNIYESENAVSLYEYDRFGNVTCESERNGYGKNSDRYKITYHSYDSRDNEILEKDDNGHCVQHYYSWDGKILRDYKGMKLPLNIDGLDDVSSIGHMPYSVIKYEYDSMGRLKQKTDPMNQSETYEYDRAGRQKTKIDKNGIKHTTTYDGAGNVIKEVNGEEGTTGSVVKTYEYDCMGNVKTKKEGDTTISYEYDGRNNCTKETEGNVVKTYKYNNSNQITESLITVNGVSKQKIENTYDESGNLIDVSENGQIKAIYTYDKWNRLVKTMNGNRTYEYRSYNAAGLPEVITNKKNSSTLSQYSYTYYFDGKERTKTEKGKTTYYIYDGTGQLTREKSYKVKDNNTLIENAVEVEGGIPYKADIDVIGRKRYFKFTPVVSGDYTIKSYNNTNNPKIKLCDSDGNVIKQTDNISDDDLNFEMSYSMEKGTTYILELSDDVGKATYDFVISDAEKSNTDIYASAEIHEDIPLMVKLLKSYEKRYYSFIAKASGEYTVEADSGDAWVFLYDGNQNHLAGGQGSPFNKITYTLKKGERYYISAKVYAGTGSFELLLTSPNQAGGNITDYQYDGNDNRIRQVESEDGSLKEILYEYDKNDRLTKMTKDSNETTYEYDNNGNLKEKSDGTKQSYDALNRMISYTSPKNETTIYTYYADDMRKSKKVYNKAEIKQVWMGDDIAMELENGNVKSSYVHGEKLICSDYGFYLYNGHGDVTMLTDSSGNVTKDYEYSSFGKQKSSTTDGDENPYRYSGEYYDMESGYTYLQARYYDSDLGRFVSEDPAMDGDNWYVYCGNDPINMVDPSGMWMGYDHKNITREAVKKSNTLCFISWLGVDEILAFASTEPDNNTELRKLNKWHGHGDYKKLKKIQLNKAVNAFKNKKFFTAMLNLGRGLHTIQDHYAHTFKKNGKTVNTWSYSKEQFYKKNNKIIAGKYPQYVDIKELVNSIYKHQNKKSKKSKSEIKKELVGKKVHKFTADYKYAQFDVEKNKWIWTNNVSSRYKYAVKESTLYINSFIKKIKGGK